MLHVVEGQTGRCHDFRKVRSEDLAGGPGRWRIPAGAWPRGSSTGVAEEIAREIPFLRRTVRRWHRQQPDADDLVQDTLVQALANAHLLQPGSSLRAWLFTIMRNQFLAAIVKANRAAALQRVCNANDAVGVEDSCEARLALRDVGAALRRLPAKQRTALQLVGVEGRSYEEVAAAMGLSVAAVRCHLARGRDRLRAALGGSDASPYVSHAAPPAPASPLGFSARPPVFAAAMAG
jgi:RNA polymerase sigma-70 factor, ECF subfamily